MVGRHNRSHVHTMLREPHKQTAHLGLKQTEVIATSSIEMKEENERINQTNPVPADLDHSHYPVDETEEEPTEKNTAWGDGPSNVKAAAETSLWKPHRLRTVSTSAVCEPR